MARFSPIFLVLFALVWGCGPTHYWYGNQRALKADVTAPASGSLDERTYVEPALKDFKLGKVFVAPAEVKLTRKDDLPSDLEGKIAKAAEAGAASAVTGSERFGGMAGDEAGADQILSVKALAHVAVVGQMAANDPVMNDARSKVIILYTLTDVKSGKVLVRHSTVEMSYWEYTRRVTEDMEKLSAEAGRGLLYVFSEM